MPAFAVVPAATAKRVLRKPLHLFRWGRRHALAEFLRVAVRSNFRIDIEASSRHAAHQAVQHAEETKY